MEEEVREEMVQEAVRTAENKINSCIFRDLVGP